MVVRKVMKVEFGAGFIGEVESVETAPEMMQGHHSGAGNDAGMHRGAGKHVGVNLPKRELIGNSEDQGIRKVDRKCGKPAEQKTSNAENQRIGKAGGRSEIQ